MESAAPEHASTVLTVFAKLSEPKLSQLSSEEDEVSMEINFTFRNLRKFFGFANSVCCKRLKQWFFFFVTSKYHKKNKIKVSYSRYCRKYKDCASYWPTPDQSLAVCLHLWWNVEGLCARLMTEGCIIHTFNTKYIRSFHNMSLYSDCIQGLSKLAL